MPEQIPPPETPLWLTVTKLVLLAVVLVGGVGLALWLAGEYQDSRVAPATAPSKGTASWGIAGDSPVRSNR